MARDEAAVSVEEARLRTVARIAIGAALLAVGFAAAIALAGGTRIALHEIAGAVLLAVTLALVLAGARTRAGPLRRRVLALSILALIVLIAMGALGAALAVGALGPAWDSTPLAFLAVYALATLVVAGIARPASRAGGP